MAYRPVRAALDRFVTLRGLRCHLREWGVPTPGRPTLVMLHGWMDVGASFQFVVDALGGEHHVVALDWRGFGRSDGSPGGYWFPDYLGDLDALLDVLQPGGAPIDLLGHSMGGNVAMIYAGVRPSRVQRLVNLEGFGMPETTPAQAPDRYAQWLDELKSPPSLRSYSSLADVAERLMKNNPRLARDKAEWLAPHWAEQRADGRWHLLGDPAHKRTNPVLYRKDEVLACWQRIAAPMLWVDGDATDLARWWGHRYPRADFDARLATVSNVQRVRLPDCGHMLHHDQPVHLAEAVQRFLS